MANLPVHAGTDPTGLALATGGAFLHFKIPPGSNWLATQWTSATAWTAASVVTVTISLDGGSTFDNFPDGAITYSSLGAKALLEITGVTDVRYQVTTAAAGTDKVFPALNAGRDA